MNTEYPSLQHLLQGYFHTDWPDCHANSWHVVEEFLDGEPLHKSRLVGEVEQLLVQFPDEIQLRDYVLDTLGSGYRAEVDGWRYRDWLKELIRFANSLPDLPDMDTKRDLAAPSGGGPSLVSRLIN